MRTEAVFANLCLGDAHLLIPCQYEVKLAYLFLCDNNVSYNSDHSTAGEARPSIWGRLDVWLACNRIAS